MKIEFTDENIQKLFGFEDAESEPIERLREYYFKKNTFKSITSDLPLRVLVGHKGTGKSALFKVAIAEDKENNILPILIKPDDIAELGKKDENFLLRIRQWKVGLIRIIGAKVFSELGLYDDNIASKLSKFGVKLISLVSDSVKSIDEKFDIKPAQKLLMENFLKTKTIIVYIDDLDRGWEGKKDDILRISALLNSIRDLSNENPGIKFRVSLRTDVYFLVRTSDESTDKIEGSVVWFKWKNHEIFVMLLKRVLTFFGESVNEESLMKSSQHHISYHLDRIMAKKFNGFGKWENINTYKVLMSFTRKRPRDLVKLCTLAAKEAHIHNSSIIRTEHFKSIFEEYSQGRIQDTINEYKTELHNIENLLFGMKPNKRERKFSDSFVFTTQQLHQKVSNIMEQNNFKFSNGKIANNKTLSQFLYKINFITARKELEDGEIDRKYFEENRYLSSSFVDFGYDWEIHPVFRWALQPDSKNDIFYKVSPSSDK